MTRPHQTGSICLICIRHRKGSFRYRHRLANRPYQPDWSAIALHRQQITFHRRPWSSTVCLSGASEKVVFALSCLLRLFKYVFLYSEYISECRHSLQNLRSKIKVRYQQLAATRDFDTAIEQRDLPDWRMKGTLVAHLHEHQSAVTKMISLTPNGPLFVSASTDCTVRLWDCNKLDGCQSINKWVLASAAS